MVVYDDLTIDVALADPLIGMMRRADGIDRGDFAALLRSAADARRALQRVRSDASVSGGLTAAAAMAAREKHGGRCCRW